MAVRSNCSIFLLTISSLIPGILTISSNNSLTASTPCLKQSSCSAGACWKQDFSPSTNSSFPALYLSLFSSALALAASPDWDLSQYPKKSPMLLHVASGSSFLALLHAARLAAYARLFAFSVHSETWPGRSWSSLLPKIAARTLPTLAEHMPSHISHASLTAIRATSSSNVSKYCCSNLVSARPLPGLEPGEPGPGEELPSSRQTDVAQRMSGTSSVTFCLHSLASPVLFTQSRRKSLIARTSPLSASSHNILMLTFETLIPVVSDFASFKESTQSWRLLSGGGNWHIFNALKTASCDCLTSHS
mmetsp:Transcript_40169/g.93353  ORF Transcript_40169/g.93353 Transcript_40169/m.93353 type:complete len:304 (-) Transcript_40169:294-1205(-)